LGLTEFVERSGMRRGVDFSFYFSGAKGGGGTVLSRER